MKHFENKFRKSHFLCIIICVLSGLTANAQSVGINTDGSTPDPTAILDIKSDAKGIFIPRMTLAQRGTIDVSGNPEGLLIYQTDGAVGFWVWKQGAWTRLADAGDAGWTHTGNAGTVDGTHFMGTTDNAPLNFRVNNQRAGRVDAVYQNAALGYLSLNANTIGEQNTALGQEALSSNSVSHFNTAVGSKTLANATGAGNTGIGAHVLWNTGIGTDNTAIGYGALYNNTTGSQNTAGGTGTLSANNTGDRNTALGHAANVGAGNLNNATALGAQAQVDASNSLVLGSVNGVNGASETVNVGIGTTNPTTRLHVVGGLRIEDGTQSSGKVLISDADGYATWQNLPVDANTTYTAGAGLTLTGTEFAATDVSETNELQSLTLSNDTLYLSDGNYAVLPTGGGTLDAAYDFGGAGAGRTITADGGAVNIAGTDGLTVNGNVGIGHTNPQASLDVRGNTIELSGSTTELEGLSLQTQYEDDNTSSRVFFKEAQGGNYGFSWLYAGNDNPTLGGTNFTLTSNYLYLLRHQNSTTGIVAMSVQRNTGNVGINTDAPTTTLDVNGQIRIRGGVPGAGKVLTSNANGTATWETPVTSTGWGLNGNAGTSSSTNFIGTTDNVSLNFRVNNQRAGRVQSNGPVFFGYEAGNVSTGIENTGMGYEAMYNNTSGRYNTAVGYQSLRANTTAFFNTAIGYRSLYQNTTGHRNVASGYHSLNSNTEGFRNTANGFYSLPANTTGINNTASGHRSLNSNTTGHFNTAIGDSSLLSNATGSNNSALGRRADVGANNLTNATAIGAYARVDAHNSIVLGSVAGVNGATETVNLGIGLNSPAARLHVAGAVAIESADASVTSDDAELTVGNQSYLRVSSNGVPANRTVVLGAGITTGQTLYIECTAAAGNGFELPDNVANRLNLQTSRTLQEGDIIQLMWNGTVWLEVHYSDN